MSAHDEQGRGTRRCYVIPLNSKTTGDVNEQDKDPEENGGRGELNGELGLGKMVDIHLDLQEAISNQEFLRAADLRDEILRCDDDDDVDIHSFSDLAIFQRICTVCARPCAPLHTQPYVHPTSCMAARERLRLDVAAFVSSPTAQNLSLLSLIRTPNPETQTPKPETQPHRARVGCGKQSRCWAFTCRSGAQWRPKTSTKPSACVLCFPAPSFHNPRGIPLHIPHSKP